jgi:hypothetical protein
MSTLRNTILAANDIKKETLTIPAWGGVEVEVRGMTGSQRAKVVAASTVSAPDDDGTTVTRQDQSILYPLLLIASVFDPETGQPVFNDTDRDAIGAKSAGVLEDVAMACCRLSGITADSITVIRKNSEATPSADSPSV